MRMTERQTLVILQEIGYAEIAPEARSLYITFTKLDTFRCFRNRRNFKRLQIG